MNELPINDLMTKQYDYGGYKLRFSDGLKKMFDEQEEKFIEELKAQFGASTINKAIKSGSIIAYKFFYRMAEQYTIKSLKTDVKWKNTMFTAKALTTTVWVDGKEYTEAITDDQFKSICEKIETKNKKNDKIAQSAPNSMAKILTNHVIENEMQRKMIGAVVKPESDSKENDNDGKIGECGCSEAGFNKTVAMINERYHTDSENESKSSSTNVEKIEKYQIKTRGIKGATLEQQAEALGELGNSKCEYAGNAKKFTSDLRERADDKTAQKAIYVNNVLVNYLYATTLSNMVFNAKIEPKVDNINKRAKLVGKFINEKFLGNNYGRNCWHCYEYFQLKDLPKQHVQKCPRCGTRVLDFF